MKIKERDVVRINGKYETVSNSYGTYFDTIGCDKYGMKFEYSVVCIDKDENGNHIILPNWSCVEFSDNHNFDGSVETGFLFYDSTIGYFYDTNGGKHAYARPIQEKKELPKEVFEFYKSAMEDCQMPTGDLANLSPQEYYNKYAIQEKKEDYLIDVPKYNCVMNGSPDVWIKELKDNIDVLTDKHNALAKFVMEGK